MHTEHRNFAARGGAADGQVGGAAAVGFSGDGSGEVLVGDGSSVPADEKSIGAGDVSPTRNRKGCCTPAVQMSKTQFAALCAAITVPAKFNRKYAIPQK